MEQAPVARVMNNDPYDDIEIVTRRLEDAGVDITVGYANWRDVGFALSDALGEAGRQYYHRVSCLNPDYNQQECDKQYDKCLRAHGTGVTIKTFFQLAKDAGVSVSIPSKTSNLSFPSVKRSEGSGGSEVNEVEAEVDEVLLTFSDRIGIVVYCFYFDRSSRLVPSVSSFSPSSLFYISFRSFRPDIMSIFNGRGVVPM